ncbi:MAG: O-antigen ligase family protein [Candidatus Eremiobacteraeota bacterium]|nr:O-antigen ligase family protein [Candidatus Eremiobacteraeota bacterium]
MTEALAMLPPVINQTTAPVPLDPWSAAGFTAIAVASGYLAFRGSPWMLGVLAFSVPFAGYRDVAHTTITLEKCVALGTAVGLLLGGAPVWPRSTGTRRVLLAGAFVLAAIALSAVQAEYRLPVAREFFKEAQYLVLLWCAATIIERTARSEVYFAPAVAASSAIVSTLAISQAIIGGAPSGILINGHALPRVAGTSEGPNQFAGYCESVLPTIWVWPMLVASYAPLRNYANFSTAAALVLSQSRAGIVVIALAYAALRRWARAAAAAALVPLRAGAIAGLLVIAGWFIIRAHAGWTDFWHLFLFDIPGQQQGGVSTRTQLWPAAVTLFLRHPLTGVGAGNFELLLSTVGLPGVRTNAGSLPLQTLAEQGLIGFAALVVFATVALRETYVRRAASPLALAACLAFAALLAHQLVDVLFFYPKAAELSFLLLGAGTAARGTSSR